MADEILRRRSTSTGSRTKGTWSFWIKRNVLNGSAFSTYVFYAYQSGAGGDALRFNDDDGGDSLRAFFYDGNQNSGFITNDKLRDPSAWQHIMCVYDSTLNTADSFANNDQTLERVKIYVNGRRIIETGGSSAQNPGVPANNLLDNWGKAGVVNALFGLDTAANNTQLQVMDHFFVDGQALTPDVFGFNKDGDGYYSAGHSYETDYRSGQWRPRLPKSIKHTINRAGGFGTNGYYLPLNDSSNPGADFHCTPNTIVKLKGEDAPQPRNGAPTTSDAFVSQLREEKGTLGFDGCIKCDGNDGLDVAANAALDLGTGDFTIEGFYYLKDHGIPVSYHSLFDMRGTGGDGLYMSLFRHNSEDKLYLYANSAVRIDNIPRKNNQWMHVAICRSSGTTRAFIDGELAGSFSDTFDYVCRNLLIGQSNANSNDLYGFISNFRIVKGTALYTSNFTRPTSPLENVSNTILLCANSSTSATASTVTPSTITAIGDVFATKNEMTGSIVLAIPFISHPTGSNLLTVGTFSNAGAWTPSDVAAPTISGGKAIWDGTTGTGLLQRAENPAVITTGNKYIVKFTMTHAAGTLQVRLGNSGYTNTFSESGTHTVNIVAGSTPTETILFYGNSFDGTVTDVSIHLQDTIRDYSADIRGSGTNKTVNVLGSAQGQMADVAECPSHYGSALVCGSGAGNYVEVVANAEFAYLYDMDHTIEFWYRNSAWDGSYLPHDSIIGLKDGTDVAWRYAFTDKNTSEDGIQLFGTNGFSTGAQTLNNDWNHCAVEQYTNIAGTTTKVYINGVVKGQSDGPNGYDAHKDSTGPIIIGTDPRSATLGDTYSFRGEIQDVRIYKGIAKYKGGFDVAKPYTPKQDSSVGIDSWRTTPDTVTNNFATMYTQESKYTLSNGNLRFDATQNNWTGYCGATHGFRTGKWYWETRVNVSTAYHIIGVMNNELVNHDIADAYAYGMTYQYDGRFYDEDGNTNNFSGGNPTAQVVGDIVSFAIDMDAKKMWVGINGTWIGGGNPSTGTSPNFDSTHGFTDGPYYTPVFISYATASLTVNFGQNPSFCGTVTAGTEPDGNGKGLFKYLPPTGFLALCDDNMPVNIADPGKHFKAVLWTGDGDSGRSIARVGFKPDLVWIANRDRTTYKPVFDSVRGAENMLRSNSDAAEGNFQTVLQSFDYDGFTVGDDGAHNFDSEHLVAWCWKAGGETIVTNNEGSVTSYVSANTDAGFSIVKYLGNSSSSTTIGHGLNKPPEIFFLKSRVNTEEWRVYHIVGDGSYDFLYLNTVDTKFDSGYALPTTSVFNKADDNGESMIAYCWHSVEGYSQIGSYKGNNDTNGPFVYCGFRPAWVLIKNNTGAGGNWIIYDSSRKSTNVNGLRLGANLTDSENQDNSNLGTSTDEGIDMLSNGFKIRTLGPNHNDDGETYIFMAFAESSFQTANAK